MRVFNGNFSLLRFECCTLISYPLQVTLVKIVFPEATISSSLALPNKQYIQKCYNKQIENGSLLNSQKYSGIYTNPNPLPFITVCFRIEVPYLVITELLYNQHVNQGRFNDLEFYEPPTPTGQELCGFNRWWSYDVKSRVKSLAKPCLTELNR